MFSIESYVVIFFGLYGRGRSFGFILLFHYIETIERAVCPCFMHAKDKETPVSKQKQNSAILNYYLVCFWIKISFQKILLKVHLGILTKFKP
ncbi:hypothetical protein AB205_0000280 [Aquarana catesbeiana]|uniref:Uncharacterized protein n=1 Tax=Aquarana catesbeiana TaxID=8400 RepID=A0A2G9RD04_AQUCT|nr:hypothetical protein AB205_0000280 [Aquarana catesbeiana]